MNWTNDVRTVLNQYSPEFQVETITSLGCAGGFSGAQFWRISVCNNDYCLRRWPKDHPSESKLASIHRLLRHVHANGFDRIPVPINCADGIRSYVLRGGSLWELTPWLSGYACFREQPNLRKLQSAMAALAHFHNATCAESEFTFSQQRSAGIEKRLDMVQRLLAGEHRRIANRICDGEWPELAMRARQIIEVIPTCALRVQQSLAGVSNINVPMQFCIRDIWFDNILFVGDEVSGIVDFGTVDRESVAGDVARLLGSMAGDNPQWWQAGIDVYQSRRPLSQDEQDLIHAFDKGNTLLSGLNWLRWIYIEQRQFDRREKILERLDDNLARLLHLSGSSS